MTPMQSTAKNTYSKRAELHRHALNPMSALPPKADIVASHSGIANQREKPGCRRAGA
jgi:hypothetical protein